MIVLVEHALTIDEDLKKADFKAGCGCGLAPLLEENVAFTVCEGALFSQCLRTELSLAFKKYFAGASFTYVGRLRTRKCTHHLAIIFFFGGHTLPTLMHEYNF